MRFNFSCYIAKKISESLSNIIFRVFLFPIAVDEEIAESSVLDITIFYSIFFRFFFMYLNFVFSSLNSRVVKIYCYHPRLQELRWPVSENCSDGKNVRRSGFDKFSITFQCMT